MHHRFHTLLQSMGIKLRKLRDVEVDFLPEREAKLKKYKVKIGGDIMEVTVTQSTPTSDDPVTHEPRREKVRPSDEQAAFALMELTHRLYGRSLTRIAEKTKF